MDTNPSLKLLLQHEALGVGKTSAGEIVRRAEVGGLTWPLPQLFDDGELERRLFTAPGEVQPERQLPIGRSCMRSSNGASVTLVLLWQEVSGGICGRLRYSRFCDLYGAAACQRRCARPTRRARSCS